MSNINDYSLSVSNITWLSGGSPNVWCDVNWYSIDNNINNLIPSSPTPIIIHGNDLNRNLGNYTGLQMIYKLNSSNINDECHSKTFITSYLYYPNDDIFIFKQSFPDGLMNTNISQIINPTTTGIYTPMIPFTEFPSWSYNDNSLLKSKLGYIEFQGRFMNDRTNYGIGLNSFEGGNEGGPVILFDNTIKPTTALVMSTSNNFMNGIFSIRTRRSNTGNVNIFNNTNFKGNNINIISNIKSSEECSNLCINTYKYCNVFTWISLNNTCQIKYNDRGIDNSNGYVSGTIGNGINGNLDYFVSGIQGNITFLPKDYEISFILSVGKTSEGIHGAMQKWGNVLQKMYNTTKLIDDDVVNYLGYWTDNGGYYYGGNPLTTEIAKELFDAFTVNNIPIRYLQLDPYWYMGGSNKDIGYVWIPRTDLFPDGLNDLYKQIGNIPFLLYSSYWSSNKTQNYYNTNYNLNLTFVDSIDFNVGWFSGPISEPFGYNNSYNFYKFILSQYNDLMIGFEVDFMDFEYEEFSYLTNGDYAYNKSVDLSAQWIAGMADANLEYNFSIQFCMSLSNYILTSLVHPSVTNARASEDNLPTAHNRWQIAYSSLLLSSVNIRPFFDVIWTVSNQPGNKYGVNRMDVEMESIIAILSNGPVGIGDNINMTNKTIINRLCNINGLLLHPSTSITPIDSMYFSNNYKPKYGELWYTYSTIKNINESYININQILSYIVFAVDVNITYNIGYQDFYPSPVMWEDMFIVYQFNDNKVGKQCKNNTHYQECNMFIFDGGANVLPILTNKIPQNNPTHLHSWSLYNVFKVQSNGWSLLGDLTKYVPVSPKRFKNLDVIKDGGIKVTVQGAANEIIIVSFLTNTNTILQIKVEFDANGDDQTLIVGST